MSKAHKKLREEDKKDFVVTKTKERFATSLIEKRAEEARRKEARIKEEFNITRKELLARFKAVLTKAIEDEKFAYKEYSSLKLIAEALDYEFAVGQLSTIADEERRHLLSLETILRDAK